MEEFPPFSDSTPEDEYLDEPEEEDRPVAPKTERTENPYRTSGPAPGVTWHDYFKKTPEDSSFDTGGETTLVEKAAPFNVMEAPRSPKKLVTMLKPWGWSGLFGRSITHTDDLFWASGSDDEDGDGHSRGDIKTPAHDDIHYFLVARQDNRGFKATWTTHKGKTLFKNAKTTDGKYIYKMGELESWLGISPAPEENTDE